jgi:hypothetical protein
MSRRVVVRRGWTGTVDIGEFDDEIVDSFIDDMRTSSWAR